MANPDLDPYNSTRIDFPSALRTIPLLISRNYPNAMRWPAQLDSFNYVKLRRIARIIRERLTVVMLYAAT